MPVAWFIAPYKRRPDRERPTRYCAMDDFTADILAAGGAWTETEVLGDRAIVKVRASVAVLTTLAGVFRRLPKDALGTPLSDLTNGQKTALRNELTDAGYSLAELQARFGSDLGAHTLGDVLRFMASRRRKPRYDADTDTIVCDGVVENCRSPDHVDAEVV